VFGTRKSAETRKALRFFSERRVKTHFVDITERAPAPRELRRFIERFGTEALIDREGRRFADAGLAHAVLSESAWLQRLVEDPHLLRLPLVRSGARLAVGWTEAAWRDWLARP
jgi:arsenate reductase